MSIRAVTKTPVIVMCMQGLPDGVSVAAVGSFPDVVTCEATGLRTSGRSAVASLTGDTRSARRVGVPSAGERPSY